MNTMFRLVPLALLACNDGDDTDTGDTDGADTDDTDTTPDTDTDVTDPFVFATDATNAYIRVDRMGMPAVATALISSTNKDAYNAADPVDDVTLTFAADITVNVGALHVALDDDLTALGLTPCEASACVDAAAPFVIPDVLTVDTTTPAGFPNGRSLPDQVIDVTLGLILLDLNVHPVNALVGPPSLNPPANDLTFGTTFPYLAAPHP